MPPAVFCDPKSRARLSREALPRFPDDTLFCRIARVVCEAECLPRKELFESWEVARRVRRRFRGGRVVDLASGHGVIAMIMLVLDDTSASALAVDARLPASATRLLGAFERAWPRLAGRVELRRCSVDHVKLGATDVVVSAHACGPLTDRVLDLAIDARARVAVLPCCHSEGKCDLGGLGGWVDASLAIDVTRAARLRAQGYRVHTQHIPATITPKNRLLLGEPIVPMPMKPIADAPYGGIRSG
jgi:hypothetical protein